MVESGTAYFGNVYSHSKLIIEPRTQIPHYRHFTPIAIPDPDRVSSLFCAHYSTGTRNTTMFIYGCVGQPSHRTVYLTYIQVCTNIKYNIISKNRRTKVGHENPKKPEGGKNAGNVYPERGSGATLGVVGYASA